MSDHPMNPLVKHKWLLALRSGEYQQCRGYLYDGHGYCCLGVLQSVQGGKDQLQEDYDNGQDIATSEIDTEYRAGLEWQTMNKLAEMNDGRADHGCQPQNFDQIADWIEANL